MLHGKTVHMGLGATHTVSLQEAREKAREAVTLLFLDSALATDRSMYAY
jgi:hypothetical protein